MSRGFTGRGHAADRHAPGTAVAGELRPAVARDDQGASVPAGVRTFEAFTIRNFRLLWSGMLFTSIAMWVQMTTVGWIAYDITGSGALLGFMNTMRIFPTLVVAPIAGVVADRVSRQGIVTSTQFLLLACTAGLGVVLLMGHIAIWHLFVFTLVAGCAQTFNMPARQTLVFDVVPRHLVPNAVALNNMAMSFSRTFGPVVGGALIVVLGAANNFFMQTAAYGVVIVLTMLIVLPARPKATGVPRRFAAEMLEGYRFAFTNRRMRMLLLLSVIPPLFLVPVFFGVMPVFAKTSFHADASGLGILLAGVGVGGFFGGLLTARLSNVDRRGLLQLVALLCFAAALLGFSVAAGVTGSIVVALPFLALAGAAESVWMTTNQTVVQLLAPDQMRGRLSSILQIGPLAWPLGTLAAGAASDVINIAIVGAVLSCMALVIGALLMLFAPGLRGMRLSELHPTEARAPA